MMDDHLTVAVQRCHEGLPSVVPATEGHTHEAIRHLEKAIALRPEDPRPYKTMGLVWARQKRNPAVALEWLKRYIEREKDSEKRVRMEDYSRSLETNLKARPDS